MKGSQGTLTLTLPLQAFWEELAQFRETLNTHKSLVSCALVALMAHGGPQGQLLGADGEEVQPEVLVQELSCCQALHGHPKIFLLQACRGGKGPCFQPNPLPWHSSASPYSPTFPTQLLQGACMLAFPCPSPDPPGVRPINLSLYEFCQPCKPVQYLHGVWITQRFLSKSICPILLQGTGTLVWGQELSHGTGVG